MSFTTSGIPVENNPFKNVIPLTLIGVFPAAGFASPLTHIQNNSIFAINFRCSKNTVFKIHASPSSDTSEKVLFFQKTVSADTNFHRKFAAPAAYIQIEVTNSDAADGDIILHTNNSLENQFDASTFLNSNIEIDANTNLIRVGNDYNIDMVRGIHSDFKKVNIQAIQDYQPSAEATIGLRDQNFLDIPVAAYEFFINLAGAQDTSGGTGARQITIDYIDTNYAEQTANISTGGGGTFTTGITGRAILRARVSSVGTGKKNSGLVLFQDNTGTHTFARIETGANVTHTGLYLVAADKHLVVDDAYISFVGFPAIVRIYEYDYGGIETAGSIGDFRLSSNNLAQVYRLNGKITEKKIVLVNVIPDALAPTSLTNINININAVLCPAINNF